MTTNKYYNLSRAEIETELEKQASNLEAKNKTIEHLMANARKWSHRFKHEVSKNAVDIAKKSIVKAELDNAELMKKLVRMERSNESLFKKIEDLQAELQENQDSFKKLQKQGQPSASATEQLDEKDILTLELPTEMQLQMSKYIV